MTIIITGMTEDEKKRLTMLVLEHFKRGSHSLNFAKLEQFSEYDRDDVFAMLYSLTNSTHLERIDVRGTRSAVYQTTPLGLRMLGEMS